MMSEALFLRLLPYNDKSLVLAKSINSANQGFILNSVINVVDPVSFYQIPSSTFAYWVSKQIRVIFSRLSAFEGEGRTAKKGITTSDDFRFVRLWWEIRPDQTVTGTAKTTPEEYQKQTFSGKQWVPFAKGGSYSPYYADIHLVVNWKRDAEELKNFKDIQTGKAFSYLRNASFYFRPGLTWPIKNRFTFKPRPLNAGCIFAHVGAAIFVPNEADLLPYQALLSSSVYTALLRLTSGWNFEVGAVQHTPIPHFSDFDKAKLRQLALACIDIKRSIDKASETSHIFYLPELLLDCHETLTKCIIGWERKVFIAEQQLNEYQNEIDNIAFRLYAIEDQDRQILTEALNVEKQKTEDITEEIDTEDEEDEVTGKADSHSLVANLLSYILGCTCGLWDIRIAINKWSVPVLPDPFAPLPVYSPGMVTGEDRLSLLETPSGYPLDVNWNGILVDDPEHPGDIIRLVRNVMRVIWQDRADAIEQEACQLLGIKELRDYFRRSGNGGFWADHLQRYSKSRRKAPIYWPLQSSKKSYAVWLYYHCLNKDTLFKVLNTVVEPKVRLEETQLEQLSIQLANVGTAGREAKQLERQLERQENFISELEDFRDKLRRAADLNLEPDLNDGVVLNIAPLWELVPWNEAKRYWQELRAGKYKWSTIGKQLRERGLV